MTVEDIRSFEEKYKGSEEEADDLKRAYLQHEGDMDQIMTEVRAEINLFHKGTTDGLCDRFFVVVLRTSHAILSYCKDGYRMELCQNFRISPKSQIERKRREKQSMNVRQTKLRS